MRKKSKNIKLFIFIIIAIIIVLLGIYVLFIKKENIKFKEKSVNGYYYASEVIIKEDNKEQAKYYNILYLYEDKSFYLSIDNYFLNQISVGTYSIDNKKIILNEKLKYVKDECYHNSGLQNYVAEVLDDNTIVLNYNKEDIYLFKNLSNAINNIDLEKYTLDPKSDFRECKSNEIF